MPPLITALIRKDIKYELQLGWLNERIVIEYHVSYRIIERIRGYWKSISEIYIEKDKRKRDFKLNKLHYNILFTYLKDRP